MAKTKVSKVTEFYLGQLEPLINGKIIGFSVTPEDEFGDQFYGLRVRVSDGSIKTLWILRDDEGNGPGSFEIADST